MPMEISVKEEEADHHPNSPSPVTTPQRDGRKHVFMSEDYVHEMPNAVQSPAEDINIERPPQANSKRDNDFKEDSASRPQTPVHTVNVKSSAISSPWKRRMVDMNLVSEEGKVTSDVLSLAKQNAANFQDNQKNKGKLFYAKKEETGNAWKRKLVKMNLVSEQGKATTLLRMAKQNAQDFESDQDAKGNVFRNVVHKMMKKNNTAEQSAKARTYQDAFEVRTAARPVFHRDLDTMNEDGQQGFHKISHKPSGLRRQQRGSMFYILGGKRMSFTSLADSFKSSRDKYLIYPDTPLKQMWDAFIIVLVLYSIVLVPIVIGFEESLANHVVQKLEIVDRVIDILFLVDMVMIFMTVIPGAKHGQLITDHKEIMSRYMRIWFWFDLIAIIPYPLELLVGTFVDGNPVWLRLFSGARLFRFDRILQLLDQLSATDFLRIFRLMAFYCLAVHWFGCFFHWIAICEWDQHHRGIYDFGERWTVAYGLEDATFSARYLVSYHFVLTTVLPGSTVVLPNTHLERVFHCVIMIFGALMNAFVFGNVASLIQGFDEFKGKIDKRMHLLKSVTSHFELPKDLRTRILNQEEQMIMRMGTYNLKDITSTMPTRTVYDVYSFVYKDLIAKSKIFVVCDEGFVRMVVSKLTLLLVLPDETLIGYEDPVEEMFFLQRGMLAVVAVKQDKDSVVAVLQPGDMVGHLALLQGRTTRNAEVRAVEICECARLDKADFNMCLDDYPDHRSRLEDFAKKEEVMMGVADKHNRGSDLDLELSEEDERKLQRHLQASHMRKASLAAEAAEGAPTAADPPSIAAEVHMQVHPLGSPRASSAAPVPRPAAASGASGSCAAASDAVHTQLQKMMERQNAMEQTLMAVLQKQNEKIDLLQSSIEKRGLSVVEDLQSVSSGGEDRPEAGRVGR